MPPYILDGMLLLGMFALPIIFGTLLVINRRDLTAVQGIGLLMLIWLIPFFGFIAAMGYLFFVAPRSR